MRVKKLEEIDQEKLKLLFERRGHGITDPSFWSKIELILQNPLMEVHQCKCGEVGWMRLGISQLNTENGSWVCKKCGKYEEEVVPYSIVHSKKIYKKGEEHILPTERNTKLLSIETSLLKLVIEQVMLQSEIE